MTSKPEMVFTAYPHGDEVLADLDLHGLVFQFSWTRDKGWEFWGESDQQYLQPQPLDECNLRDWLDNETAGQREALFEKYGEIGKPA